VGCPKGGMMFMDAEKFRSILKGGEGVSVEFKVCQKSPGDDTYETICSFLNRVGGDIFLGVRDDGTVRGVPNDSVQKFINDITSTISNPKNFSPTVYLAPEHFVYEDKDIIHIPVHSPSEVYRYKGVIHDRTNSSDVKVTSISAITLMYNRKQNIFTERKVFPNIKDDDMRFDLFPKIRKMILGKYPDHPWKDMTDKEIIQSAGLYSEDPETGKQGYNLAAILLLGKDSTIKRTCPTHRTDVLLRKYNVDRYDDRLIVETNLIESYPLMLGFAEKHLLDKFYLEKDQNISLRGIIAREMLINSLMHREFTSTYFAKFVIEKDRMFTENANRAAGAGPITPDSLEPISKNPIIAAFFRNIGYADELGSGTRKLHRYVKLYSGKDPLMMEGDFFKIIVPLNDEYSFDANIGQPKETTADVSFLSDTESKVYRAICGGSVTTIGEIAAMSGVPERTVRRAIGTLGEGGLITRKGSKKTGKWVQK